MLQQSSIGQNAVIIVGLDGLLEIECFAPDIFFIYKLGNEPQIVLENGNNVCIYLQRKSAA